jgi:hypothetical protein
MAFFNAETPQPLEAYLTGGKMGSFAQYLGNGSTQVSPGTLDLNSLVQKQQGQPGSSTYNWQQMMAQNPQLNSQVANVSGIPSLMRAQ